MANFACRIRKFFAQEIDEPRIFFQRKQTCAVLQDITAECAKARLNFQNKILSADLSLPDDPAREILIVQKILPEFFCQDVRQPERVLFEFVTDSRRVSLERPENGPTVHKKL